MTNYFRQCVLAKDGWQQVEWINERDAHVGCVLSDGWKIIEVWSQRLRSHKLVDSHWATRQHRKRTGDSLPKTIDKT